MVVQIVHVVLQSLPYFDMHIHSDTFYDLRSLTVLTILYCLHVILDLPDEYRR